MRKPPQSCAVRAARLDSSIPTTRTVGAWWLLIERVMRWTEFGTKAVTAMATLMLVAACGAVSDVSETDSEGDGDSAEAALTASLGVGVDLRTTANLRMRQAPSRNAATLTIVPRGALVKTVDGAPRDGFYQVEYQGKRGFCHGSFLVRDEGGGVSPGPSPAPGPQPQSSGSRWQPRPGTKWQWQLQGSVDIGLDVDAYDIDLADTPKSTIDRIHAAGRRAICYFSAGSYENWRSDANQIPSSARGKVMDGWPNEKWIDIRNGQVRALMKQRLDLAAQKGCDAVEPDNVDGYTNDTGFNLTGADQLSFNRFLATEAHARGLAVGLKNDLDQIPQLVGAFDFAVNEQCFEYGECDSLSAFVDAGKAVLQVEYGGAGKKSSVCPKANAMNFDSMIKNLSLDAWRLPCR